MRKYNTKSASDLLYILWCNESAVEKYYIKIDILPQYPYIYSYFAKRAVEIVVKEKSSL